MLLTRAGLKLNVTQFALTQCNEDLANFDAPLFKADPFLDVLTDSARDLARALSNDRTVGSEHFLLALLQLDAHLRQSLEKQGLKFDQLRMAILGPAEQDLRLDEPLRFLDATDEVDVDRIMDAAANRAREALRVMEDYCRFAVDDAFLTRQCKHLRHELAEAFAEMTPTRLLEARDTIHDVGTMISTPAEQARASLQVVIQANCKRLQEALRSLEEYGKLRRPQIGKTLESLRYQTYTLERAILLGTAARQRLADVRLYVLLSSEKCQAALDWTIKEAAAGGAEMIQLREKNLNDRELLDKARNVRRWTREAGVLLIINDRPDIARLTEADGVHLGQDDFPVKEARRIIGPEALIGVSTHNLEQVRQAVLDGASYIGVGPTFLSGTKEFTEFPGLDFARAAAAETALPAFVIGGVNLENIGQVVAAGLNRVAISEAICQADEPRQVAKQLRQAFDRQ